MRRCPANDLATCAGTFQEGLLPGNSHRRIHGLRLQGVQSGADGLTVLLGKHISSIAITYAAPENWQFQRDENFTF